MAGLLNSMYERAEEITVMWRGVVRTFRYFLSEVTDHIKQTKSIASLIKHVKNLISFFSKHPLDVDQEIESMRQFVPNQEAILAFLKNKNVLDRIEKDVKRNFEKGLESLYIKIAITELVKKEFGKIFDPALVALLRDMYRILKEDMNGMTNNFVTFVNAALDSQEAQALFERANLKPLVDAILADPEALAGLDQMINVLTWSMKYIQKEDMAVIMDILRVTSTLDARSGAEIKEQVKNRSLVFFKLMDLMGLTDFMKIPGVKEALSNLVKDTYPEYLEYITHRRGLVGTEYFEVQGLMEQPEIVERYKRIPGLIDTMIQTQTDLQVAFDKHYPCGDLECTPVVVPSEIGAEPALHCQSPQGEILVFPKSLEPTEPISGDIYDPSTCHQVSWNGRPSLYCEGEKTTTVIASSFEKPLESFVGNVGLLAVLYQWVKNIFSKKEEQLKEEPIAASRPMRAQGFKKDMLYMKSMLEEAREYIKNAEEQPELLMALPGLNVTKGDMEEFANRIDTLIEEFKRKPVSASRVKELKEAIQYFKEDIKCDFSGAPVIQPTPVQKPRELVTPLYDQQRQAPAYIPVAPLLSGNETQKLR